MKPFERYPGSGHVLPGALRGTNARHEYGLQLQRVTGEHACAYCGLDLTATYEHWLLLQVDHVVPVSVALKLGVPRALYQDLLNCVLACSACNGFDNRFAYLEPIATGQWSLEAFVELRDLIFALRQDRIAKQRISERAFYDAKPWLMP
jgi:hypothetical protein